MYTEARKKPFGSLAVVALVFGGHAAVFAAIASRAPIEAESEPEPMMVSLVADSEPVKAELQAKPEPVREQPRKEAPAKRQPQPQPVVVQPTPEPQPAPLPVTAEPKAEPVPQAQPHQEVVAQAAPAPALTPAPAEPVVQQAEPEPAYQPPRFGVAYLHNPSPEYPPVSRRLREQGKVMLRVMVTPTGEPSTIELEKSSGFERLDQAAMDAVKQWRFVPAKRGEQPIAAWVVVPLSFSVKG